MKSRIGEATSHQIPSDQNNPDSRQLNCLKEELFFLRVTVESEIGAWSLDTETDAKQMRRCRHTYLEHIDSMILNQVPVTKIHSTSFTKHDVQRSQEEQEQMHRDLAVNNLRRNSDGGGLRRRSRIHPPLFIYARQVSSDSHETDWGYFPKEIDTNNDCDNNNIVQARILDIEEKIHIITSLATSEEKSKLSENKVRVTTSDNEDNYTNDVSFLPPHAMSSLVSASEASRGSSLSSLIKLYAPLLPSIMGDDVSDYTDDIIIEDMMMSEEPVRPQRHYWSQSWSKITTNETTSRVSSRTGACEVGSIVVGASAVGATIVGAFVTGALVVGFSVMGASALVVCIVTAGSYTARA
jgi:hypothetical protein